MSRSMLHIACLQMSSTRDKDENIAQALELANDAVLDGATFLVTPEVFNCRISSEEHDMEDYAEPLTGPSVKAVQKFAKERHVFFLIGSMIERDVDGQLYNTSVLINNDGEIVGTYRKLHLFDAEIAEKQFHESKVYAAGDAPHSVDLNGVRVGLSICYDLRFPELYRIYAKEGADILFVPSSFTAPTGEAHWEVLCRARAIENQAYVVAPNQVGIGASGVPSYGNSLIVDPWGIVVARGHYDRPEIVSAIIDKAVIDDVRRKLPALEHRRL